MGQEMNAKEYVAGLMERARNAQKLAESLTQEKVDELVTALAWTAVKVENAQKLAKLAVEESRMGNYESKYIKITKKVRGALRDLKGVRSVGIIEENNAKGLVKIAKPAGVIGVLAPCTNPEATPVIKSMAALKGRNAVVISPHPRTKKTNLVIVELMRETLKKYGVPEDLIVTVEDPTMEISAEVMKQCDLIVATGGSPMVRAAYSSGTPAVGVGTGNAVVVVDETADIKDAAMKVMVSKTFDYATSCSADNALVIQESVYDEMVSELIKVGGYLVKEKEKAKLQSAVWVDGHLNPAIIAQSAYTIASISEIHIGEEKKFIMVPETGVGNEYPFSGEKLSVILTLYKYGKFSEAVEKVNRITDYMGRGHSCGIHSFNEKHIMELAMNTKTSRVMVRQATSAANTGSWDNGMAFTMTLGCGTWGGNSTSENVTWKHMINTTWVSSPIESHIPTDEELFGDIMRE